MLISISDLPDPDTTLAPEYDLPTSSTPLRDN